MLFRGYTLYAAIGFVVLIPVVTYHTVSAGLPKKILLIVIPAYILMPWSFFSVFKALKPK